MTPGERIELAHLPSSLVAPAGDPRPADDPAGPAGAESQARPEDATLLAAREEFERRYILQRYHECGGNMSRTAEALGVERSNLYRKMKAYGLLPAKRERGDDAFEA
jgi:two-component system nitrogen regulation response regulator NtrX